MTSFPPLTPHQRFNLALLSFLHLFTDLVSVFVLMVLAQANWQIITYNFFAFALQLPLGYLIDRFLTFKSSLHQLKLLLYFALGLLLFSLIYLAFAPTLFLIIAVSIANAIFHLSAGKQVIDYHLHRTLPSGFFVSFGAIGLSLGIWLAVHFSPFTPAILSLVCLLFVIIIHHHYHHRNQQTISTNKLASQISHLASQTKSHSHLFLLLSFMALIIAIADRSWLGLGYVFSWKTGAWLIASTAAVFLGKIAGGWLADRYGWRLTAISGTIISCLTLPWAWTHPLAGLISLFCFQLPMSITLMALVHYLPRFRTTAFGFNCFALFLGYLPIIGGYYWSGSSWNLLVVLAVVTITLYLGISPLQSQPKR